MKKIIFLVLCGFVSVKTFASSPVIVYENEQALREGKSQIFISADKGVLIPARLALDFSQTLLAGLTDGELKKTSLIRLDNALNVAYVELTDIVLNPDFQKLHKERSAAILGFLPGQSVVEPSLEALSESASLVKNSDIFLIKINGQELGEDVIKIDSRFKKAQCDIEIVRNSTAPAWGFGLVLESQPPLGFWKEGRRTSLNDIPVKKFKYDHQSLFKAMKKGHSNKVAIEVFYIKESNYLWTIQLKNKDELIEKKVYIQFENK
ncbi:MAG: hypothetical protein ACKVQC_05205 [Elusimicrobiota bacterium]